MKPCVYKNMLVLTNSLTKQVKLLVDDTVQYFKEQGLSDNECHRRAQISWNHEHLTKSAARKKISEVNKLVKDRWPEYAHLLCALWKETSNKSNAINLSFYFDPLP